MSVETATAAITHMMAAAAEPTILDESTGRVASGPQRVNMAVVYSPKQDNSHPNKEEEDKMIGLGGAGWIHTRDEDGKKIRAADMGVMIDPTYRGRGFAVEAMRLAAEWGFIPVKDGGPQFDLVTMTTLEENVAMVRLVENKLGLKGVRRESKEKGVEGKMEVHWEVDAEKWERRGKD
jgi:RimJ/RimL family protein N-acetyltransferase